MVVEQGVSHKKWGAFLFLLIEMGYLCHSFNMNR